MTVIVTACAAFGPTASEIKTEIMCLQTIDGGGGAIHRHCSWPGEENKAGEFVCFGRVLSANWDLSVQLTVRIQRTWACFGRYKMKVYDRPGVRLRLNVRLFKTEVRETLRYGCVKWSPKPADHDRPRRVHHKMLLRFFGWRKRKRNDHPIPRPRAS